MRREYGFLCMRVGCSLTLGLALLASGFATAQSQGENEMKVTKEQFGKLADGTAVDLYTLTNNNGMKATITNYGGIIVSLLVPDKNGDIEDVTLGFDSLDEYVEGNSPYFGALVGRFANRIGGAKFTLDGKTYQLAVNNGPNHLHGGNKGFDKVVWKAKSIQQTDAVGVELNYVSKDGEENYPGTVDTTVTYLLTNDNELKIDYRATSDAPTPINLTNHAYFNLDGQGEGDILDHVVMLNADRYTPTDEGAIPTGELPPVKGTPFDFTTPTPIGLRINDDHEQIKFGGGYDHSYVLNKKEQGELSLAARVTGPDSGRVMEVYTTQPAVQLYCGNFLDGTVTGKNGKVYNKRYGFCLETQHYPDSPNQPDFPSTILRPGDTFHQVTIYKFLNQ